MSGREVPIGWQGRAARAWLPDPLALRDLDLSERTGPEYPVLSAATTAEALGTSERASRTALETMAARGIVAPFRRASRPAGRPRRWWVAAELLDLLTAWSRPG
jgi:hypothetical protein